MIVNDARFVLSMYVIHFENVQLNDDAEISLPDRCPSWISLLLDA